MISFMALEMNVHCLERGVWAGWKCEVGGRGEELGGRVGSVRKGGGGLELEGGWVGWGRVASVKWGEQ